MRFKRFGVRESPLLPYHTGSTLPSKRPNKAFGLIYRSSKYGMMVLVLLAGIYALAGILEQEAPGTVHRSGRSLAGEDGEEDLQQRSSLLPGMRSHRGREDKLESEFATWEDVQLRPIDVDPNEAMREVVMREMANTANGVYQPVEGAIENSTNNIKEVVDQAAESSQHGAGNADAASNFVVNEPHVQHDSQQGEAHLPAGHGLYSFVAKGIDGQDVPLSKYSGKVSLVVNVASQCGFTDSNYRGLNELYNEYKEWGFEILAFPCDSWHQETGSDVEIKAFAQSYGAQFPLFAKVEATGPRIHPIFQWLTSNLPDYQTTGWQPKWNFSKWLVGKDGFPVKSYDSAFDLDRLSVDIYDLLTAGVPNQSEHLAGTLR